MSSLRDKLAEIRDDLAFVSTNAATGCEPEIATAGFGDTHAAAMVLLDAAHDALVDVIVELDAAALKEIQ